jgi:hypothetical protein
VLRILGADLDWVTMYKVFEIVRENTRRGETGIAAAGWATTNEMKLFRRTANSVGALGDRARHGRRDPMPPPVPMPQHDAVGLIRRLARRWLDSLL